VPGRAQRDIVPAQHWKVKDEYDKSYGSGVALREELPKYNHMPKPLLTLAQKADNINDALKSRICSRFFLPRAAHLRAILSFMEDRIIHPKNPAVRRGYLSSFLYTLYIFALLKEAYILDRRL
jgi:hypothetical protein